MAYTLFPPDASANGLWVERLFWLGFWLTASAFLVVVAILGYCVWKFRAAPGRRAHYTHGESRVARWGTALFAVAVFVLFDVNLALQDHRAWEAMWGTPPQADEALRVEIMPEQFAWNIRYAGADGVFRTGDDVTTINQLHVPADRMVIVQLSSKDVIHSLFLPHMRIKMDAVPGMVTSLYFTPRIAGAYELACAEHCGFGHYRMKGQLVVEPPAAFAAWLAEQAQEPPDATWGWDWERRS
jgi:cytochrome c oxidase subunit 2